MKEINLGGLGNILPRPNLTIHRIHPMTGYAEQSPDSTGIAPLTIALRKGENLNSATLIDSLLEQYAEQIK
ncbi:MAG TPA: hypothetical protein EYQ18_21420 [Candidatus Handelsmanbacteria bacterium]|nr:hypothetical protein [Candidatus Handelsmanbacteria bacterium]